MKHSVVFGKDLIVSVFVRGFVWGLLGLSSFYYLLLFAVTGDAFHPLAQFVLFQPWMSLLIFGFAVQTGLFWLMRKGVYFSLQEKTDAKLATGTGTAVSGVAMVACCAHHIVDLLPIVGLSAVAVFLGEYQEQFLIFGVLANLIGIVMMLWFIFGRPKMSVVFGLVVVKIKKLL